MRHDELAHYGVKGMKWRRKKGVTDVYANRQEQIGKLRNPSAERKSFSVGDKAVSEATQKAKKQPGYAKGSLNKSKLKKSMDSGRFLDGGPKGATSQKLKINKDIQTEAIRKHMTDIMDKGKKAAESKQNFQNSRGKSGADAGTSVVNKFGKNAADAGIPKKKKRKRG